MITQQTEISKLIEDADYKKIKLYVDLGFELTLTDLNGDYCYKFGNYNNKIFDYVMNNNLDKLKQLNLKRINDITKSGYSILHLAIILHKNDIVKYLLENNASIEATNIYKENAFTLAARFNNNQAMQLLLEKTQNQKIVFKNNFRDFNVLLFAACNKNFEMIAQLIPYATQEILWQRNIFGANCLHWLVHGTKLNDNRKLLLIKQFIAIASNNVDSPQGLINGLLNHVNAIGYSPLNWLEKYNNHDSYMILKRYAGLNIYK